MIGFTMSHKDEERRIGPSGFQNLESFYVYSQSNLNYAQILLIWTISDQILHTYFQYLFVE